jgi:hypothetical protein
MTIAPWRASRKDAGPILRDERQGSKAQPTSYDAQVNEEPREGRNDDRAGRWQRRDQRRTNERERLQKHAAGLRTVYRDAILKRMRDKKRK